MRARYLVPLVLLLAACGTQQARCPVDSTSNIDATITQVTRPVLFSAGSRHAPVEYAITIDNRTDEPMRVTAMTLEMPYFIAGGQLASLQCLGLDRLDDDVVAVSQGFDRSIPPRSSAVFNIRTRVMSRQVDPVFSTDLQDALTLHIRTESAGRTRSERLTRKVTLRVAEKGDRS